MRVFMLGWEFPPFITGGLGTACYGLTKALSRHHTQIIFVLPKPVSSELATHVRLLSPRTQQGALDGRSTSALADATTVAPSNATSQNANIHASDLTGGQSSRISAGTDARGVPGVGDMPNVTFRAVPSRIGSPYQSAGGKFHPLSRAPRRLPVRPGEMVPQGELLAEGEAEHLEPIGILSGPATGGWTLPGQAMYQGDLVREAHRYARLCVDLAMGERFDVIHAHDWLTYPAGLAVAAATGRPLVVHVHATEFDRSGQHVNQPVYDIERRGMHGAMRIIAVSHLTKSILVHRYGVDEGKVEVVYNGIESDTPPGMSNRTAIRRGDKIVLFLGRITMQKGPEYFIRAARKVLDKYDKVKFVMAGSGDMIQEIIELAAAEGIGQKILFTGFLHGADVERIFKMADLYVMPSVSEPFGIAPLEAISHDVPVIISKTSGVSEVITHALKVDFWDIDEMANKIIAVLKHPPLSSTLREHADMEVRRLTWDDAALKCLNVYQQVVDAMPV